MKKIIFISLLCFPMLSMAELSEKNYFEAQIGVLSIDDVKSKSVTTVEAGTINGSLDYENATSYGLEYGYRLNPTESGFIVSFAWVQADAKLDSLSGSVSGGTQVPPISGKIPPSTLDSIGFDFDNMNANIFSGNVYYEFILDEKFRPYLGLGWGQANIDNAKDKENALIWTIGGRYAITDKIFAGLKYQYFNIDGPTDELGIKYKDLKIQNISATLSYSF